MANTSDFKARLLLGIMLIFNYMDVFPFPFC